MDNMLPIWLFLFWTIGVPVLWLFFDHLQTQRTMGTYGEGSKPLRAPMTRQA